MHELWNDLHNVDAAAIAVGYFAAALGVGRRQCMEPLPRSFECI
jgi:hypothetical protein